MTTLPTISHFIGGKSVPSSTGATYDVYNPATGQVIEHAAAASAEDCKAAIDSAQAAFESWQSVTPQNRAKIFKKAAELVVTEEYSKAITKFVIEETGCTPFWAQYVNVTLSKDFLEEAGDLAYAVKGEILPSDYGAQSFVFKRPMGVIFIISPWNAPVGLIMLSALPALAAGNTVVLKTSENSPGGQVIAAKLLHEAGLPQGVLNIIHTAREDSGPRVADIIAHPAVQKIGFTGSDRVGKIIAAEAAKYLKPCVFELGGKAPAVVLDDANIEAAARAVISGAYNHSGQMCIATERVIVQRGVSEQFIEHVKAIAAKMKTGPPGSDAKLSCQFTAAAALNIVSMISEAVADGAELLVGDLKADGAFVKPHIVLGAKPGQRLWDRESFGPVFTIAIVDSVDEAVKLANATTYSLTSSLWTKNMSLALEVSRKIHAGKVIINGPTYMHESKFHQQGLGGSSGYGTFSVDSFVNVQLVSFQSEESQKAYVLTDM